MRQSNRETVTQIKVGVSSYAFRWAIQTRALDVFGLLQKSAALGAQVVQILDNCALDQFPDATLDDIARCARRLGLTLEIGIVGSRPEQLRRNIVVAQKLDARILRVVLSQGNWQPTVTDLVPILRDLLPALRAANVILAIENHFDLLPEELVSLLQIIDDPRIGICLDPLNSISQLIGPREVIAALAPYTVSAHCKDGIVTRVGTGFYITGCPLGKGRVDLREMLATLRAANRAPNLLVEAWMEQLEDTDATLAQEEAWVREGIAFLKQLTKDR